MTGKFDVVIEMDAEGWLVASVPSLHGCHTQARSFHGLEARIRGAIELCLDDDDAS
ncbi:type II toxin-antitoxin system HicB family antitoxin [Haloferula sp. BvORR071]|uniref:type II toxin-antitoxin system HicB family antitoxin n=1 Tax=Haloferula sp. BvORR071 TaxID=1396141 RepID=UPI0009462BF8|nr:type II toxin-antitoxin system HicB family antitoxin [Haloferula sp. BvORR071]